MKKFKDLLGDTTEIELHIDGSVTITVNQYAVSTLSTLQREELIKFLSGV